MDVPGASWPAGGILHRQGESVPYGSQDRSQQQGSAAGRTGAVAPNADRARTTRVWGLCGLRRILRKPKDESSAVSAQRGAGW
jgi:hypothetical protein